MAPGRYEVVVYYTCPKDDVGSTVELDFKPWRMGVLELPAGRGDLTLRALTLAEK